MIIMVTCVNPCVEHIFALGLGWRRSCDTRQDGAEIYTLFLNPPFSRDRIPVVVICS